MRWAVGVMAAPRTDYEGLEQCLTSVENAGWAPTVYAEPGVPEAVGDRCQTVFRPDTCINHPDLRPGPTGRFGNVQNWVQTAADLMEVNEDAEAYLTIEDDAVVCAGAKAFIEKLIWPSAKCGAISLYAANITSCRKSPPQMFLHRRHGIMGTLFMIWRPECLRQIVWGGGVKDMMSKLTVPPESAKAVDTWLGNELNRLGWDLWTVTPSLVHHWHPFGRSAYSSLGHGPATGKRQAYKFVGVNANLDQVFARYLTQIGK